MNGFDCDVYDRYLKDKVQENYNYLVISEKMWGILSQKFGFDVCVKRIYSKIATYSYYTTLEITLKRVPVLIVYAEKLKSGSYNKSNF
jgi:hypothetical protein